MKVQLSNDNAGILKASELTDEPFVGYVGAFTDIRNDKVSECHFQAQNDTQAMKILNEQTAHWSAVIDPTRSRLIYTNLKVRKS